MKGNEQKAEYEEPGKKTWETRSGRTGTSKEVERWRGSTEEATVRRRREERGKEETEGQVARTGTEVDERKRKERGKPESESIREAPEEQLRERIREG